MFPAHGETEPEHRDGRILFKPDQWSGHRDEQLRVLDQDDWRRLPRLHAGEGQICREKRQGENQHIVLQGVV